MQIRVIDAGIHTWMERHELKILGQNQFLFRIDAQEVFQLHQLDRVIVLRLQEQLLCVCQLDRGAQHVETRLAARCEKLLDVRQMRLVFLDRFLADLYFFLRLEHVVISLDYRQAQILPRTLRLEPRRVHANLGALDIRLVFASGINRKAHTKRKRTVIPPILVVRPAVRQIAAKPEVKAVGAPGAFEIRPRRLLAFLRDAERRILL